MQGREVTDDDERSLPTRDGSLYLGQTKRTGAVKLVQQPFKNGSLEFLLPEGKKKPAGSVALTQEKWYSGQK